MSGKERFRPYSAVYAILTREKEIFLIRRAGTGWMDGYWGLPSGHLEGEEMIAHAAAREVQEEIGVKVEPEDLRFVHIMHRMRKDDREYLDFYFEADTWKGEPYNAEPEKADDAGWFDIEKLPDEIIPSTKEAIEHYRNKIFFSEFGSDGRY